MRFIDSSIIAVDKELNDLDHFVLDFAAILCKHTSYALVSGYVAILLGRARGSEDVDVLIKSMSRKTFISFYSELLDNGYWCLNGDDSDELYPYLTDGLSLRFAKKNEAIPNMEVKFALKPFDSATLADTVAVKTSGGELVITSLERQIAYKRVVLGSEKDMADAEHLEDIAKGNLDANKLRRIMKELQDGKA
ncbi:TPA: hypothetical protein HA361_06840 [Candidatus Woesearchaeota archaeon]|nr:hypothetical protein [Candidatus Woesearchaeota archaeon]HII69194.1 hypothetical protein [Candidatus Woesearchaeota archaeon]